MHRNRQFQTTIPSQLQAANPNGEKGAATEDAELGITFAKSSHSAGEETL